MIMDADKGDKDQAIDFEEFLDMMTTTPAKTETKDEVRKVFRLFDDDSSGSITLRNLRRVAQELGKELTE